MTDLPLEIDVQTLHDWRQKGREFILLDCREASEFQIASITGAKLMPMSDWPTHASELEAFRDQSIVVHCHHGGRSMRITQWLRQNGYTKAQNLAGGIDAWSREIDPQIPRY